MGTIVAKMALPARLAVAVVAAALLMVLEPVTSALPAAPTSPALEVALETTATATAMLSAVLAHARYGRSGQRSDLALSAAWLAIGAVFGTFALLNHLAYPSMPTDWSPADDVLWLAYFVCLLAGGAAEIRRAQRALTATAVEEERRRIARDLHDGAAQDLAFILHVARRLTERDRLAPELRQLAKAAQRALDNTRHAIGDLARPGDEPLTSALRRTAQEIAEREGARADVEGALDVSVSAATRDSLCLLVREAVTNALRHGGARTVRVSVQDAAELRLRISDDGRGFDPELARQSVGRLGLRGMGQRVGQLGGDLQITSQPGHGTEVLVVLP